MSQNVGRLLNRAALEAAYVTYSTIFDMALSNTSVIYPELATVMTDVGPVTEMKWIGDVPVMTEWLGQRTISRLRAESHTLRTKWYANGIELEHDDLAEDKLGIVRPRIEQLAKMGPRKIDALVIDYYTSGFAATLGTTFDGQYLFDTDHTADTAEGSTSQSNLQTGALSSTTWNAALQKMALFTGTNGEPLEITADTLVVGPANQLTARKLLQQQFLASGESNIDQGTASLIVNARIAGAAANYWFALARNGHIRPVIVGVQFPPEFASLIGFEERDYFFNRTGFAGAHMKIGLCYGQWQSAVGSTG
jgi:phage major head subunit gpT-like protein